SRSRTTAAAGPPGRWNARRAISSWRHGRRARASRPSTQCSRRRCRGSFQAQSTLKHARQVPGHDSRMTQTTRGALIFGARNLGRSIIEALLAQGWNVAGAARSDETLANVAAAGALALRSDITDQVAVRAAVEEAAHALGAIDLVVNAAAAYGGTRTGPF